MQQILETFRLERQEAITQLIKDTTTVIEIPHPKGTSFYALIEPSEFGYLYIHFLSPEFNKIKQGAEKYEFWWKEYLKIKELFEQWKRNPSKPFPLSSNEASLSSYFSQASK